AQATLVGIVLFRTPGQRLGQTAHCVPSALKQCAQRRGQRRISVAKDRVQVLQDVHRTSEKRMAFFLRGRERSVFLFPGASVVRLFVERISERLLLFAPRLVCRLGFLVGRFESQVVERLLERPVLVFTAAASFFERALNSFLLATVVLVQLVPQRFGGFRVCHAAGSLVFWERQRGLFRAPLQRAVDLSGDPLNTAEHDFARLRAP